MKAAELRAKDIKALQAELLERRKEQFNLRIQAANEEARRPDLSRRVRRDIARIKTIINEKLAAGEQA